MSFFLEFLSSFTDPGAFFEYTSPFNGTSSVAAHLETFVYLKVQVLAYLEAFKT